MGRFIVAGPVIGLAAACWGAAPVETGGLPDPAKWGNRPPENAKPRRPGQAGKLAVTAFGDASAAFRPHHSGDEFEYSENAIVQYSAAPDPGSFKASFSIEPQAAVSMYFGGNYNPATDFWGQTSLVDKDFKPYPGFHVFQRFAK